MASPLRRTMGYLGLADEDYEYDHQSGPVAPVAPVAHNSAPAPSRGSVTPLRRASNHRGAAAEMNEILTVNETDARRLIDFACGLSEGLYGKIERVTSKVFLLSPAHVAVSGDHAEAESDVDASFFA